MDIEKLVNIIGVVFTIVAGILTIIFGQKPLITLINERKTRRKRKPSDFSEKKLLDQSITIVTSNNIDTPANPVTESFKDLIQKGKYREAVANAEIEKEKLKATIKAEGATTQFELDDFDVWHARALIYTGKTQNGIKKLDDIIYKLENEKDETPRQFHKNLILGRAHNDKGYVNWMILGHYRIAIQEFSAAIRYFAMQKKEGDLLATSCDNLGRVYSQLGHRIKAELLIEHGRSIRANLENGSDRYALSLISSGIMYLSFGDPFYAMELSKEGLTWFSPLNKRGQGLAYIIQGQAQRHIGALWEHKKPRDRSLSQKYLKNSLETLHQAEIIFKGIVHEPIRLIQVYNEMGCTYRELSQLEAANRNEDEAIKKANDAHSMLERSLEIAKTNKYDVAFVDGCEDLARLYKNLDELDATKSQSWINKARNTLREAEQVIEKNSPKYFIRAKKFDYRIRDENCIDDFWQHLGKMYLLKGHLIFDVEYREDRFTRKESLKALSKALENYVLAMGYFSRFLDSARLDNSEMQSNSLSLKTHRAFSEELYWRLRNLNYETIKDVKEKILPQIITKYGIQDEWIRSFYKDVIDLLAQIKGPH